MQVTAVALEQRMGPHREDDVEVARGTTRNAGLALGHQAQPGPAVDARRHLHRDGLLSFDPAVAPAVSAGVRDHLPGSTAHVTRPVDAEEALLKRDLPHAPAALAGLRGSSLPRPAARARLAGAHLRDLDRRLGPGQHIVEVDLEVVPQVGAALSSAPAAAPRPTAEVPAPEDVPEQVAEQIREAAEVAEVGASGHTDPDALVAEAVVAGSLLGVREHRIGLGDLLEALLGLGIVRVAVGVALQSEPAVGLLELGVADTSVDA